MIVGFNTDVKYRNEIFHVQTEDKGAQNPIIETLVYLQGEIVVSRRISYASLLEAPHRTQKIKDMMKVQHDHVISELKNGNYSHLLLMDTQNIEERSLDELILDYLKDTAS